MSDLFQTRGLCPMLIGAESEPFDDPDCLFELKLDGGRCLAYVGDGETVLINKRNLLVSPIYPELSGIHRQVKGRCILDGELVVMSDGRPNFSEMQRRALMSDPFKVKLASEKLPVSFIAFDILYQDDAELINRPLMERKALLKKVVKESERLAVSRFIEGKGKDLYALTERQGLEGVVAKKQASLYYPGKRTKDWVKIKNLQDEDFVVCGYIRKDKGVISLVLGQYRGKEMVYKGHVTLGVAGANFRRVELAPPADAPFPVPKGNDNAVWIAPQLVCTVKFMEKTANGGLRQPVLKGLRDDKRPEECVEVLA